MAAVGAVLEQHPVAVAGGNLAAFGIVEHPLCHECEQLPIGEVLAARGLLAEHGHCGADVVGIGGVEVEDHAGA